MGQITESQLAKEIASLKELLGDVRNSRRVIPIDSGIRQDIFKTLIETLKVRYDLEEDDFDGPIFLRLILETSVNPNSERKEGWKRAVTDDWRRALASKFPRELIMHDPSTETKVERKTTDRQETTYSKTEYVNEDPRLQNENPIDRSIFEGLPPVVRIVDEEFEKLLEGKKDE